MGAAGWKRTPSAVNAPKPSQIAGEKRRACNRVRNGRSGSSSRTSANGDCLGLLPTQITRFALLARLLHNRTTSRHCSVAKRFSTPYTNRRAKVHKKQQLMTPSLRGVGFLRACLLAALPSRAFLPPCERDARVPSMRDAGNAGVPPAIPTAREKTYPFKLLKVPPACRGNRVSAPLAVPLAKRGEPKGGGQFINSERAIGITREPNAGSTPSAFRRSLAEKWVSLQQSKLAWSTLFLLVGLSSNGTKCQHLKHSHPLLLTLQKHRVLIHHK
jgi:hypothetical protein